MSVRYLSVLPSSAGTAGGGGGGRPSRAHPGGSGDLSRETLRCSVSSLIRKVRRATCTSADPVSVPFPSELVDELLLAFLRQRHDASPSLGVSPPRPAPRLGRKDAAGPWGYARKHTAPCGKVWESPPPGYPSGVEHLGAEQPPRAAEPGARVRVQGLERRQRPGRDARRPPSCARASAPSAFRRHRSRGVLRLPGDAADGAARGWARPAPSTGRRTPSRSPSSRGTDRDIPDPARPGAAAALEARSPGRCSTSPAR